MRDEEKLRQGDISYRPEALSCGDVGANWHGSSVAAYNDAVSVAYRPLKSKPRMAKPKFKTRLDMAAFPIPITSKKPKSKRTAKAGKSELRASFHAFMTERGLLCLQRGQTSEAIRLSPQGFYKRATVEIRITPISYRKKK